MPATINVQGVVFECASPSFWRLSDKHYDMRGEVIDVSFLGGLHQWCLFHKRSDGEILTRLFPTRDAALGMIVEAFYPGA